MIHERRNAGIRPVTEALSCPPTSGVRVPFLPDYEAVTERIEPPNIRTPPFSPAGQFLPRTARPDEGGRQESRRVRAARIPVGAPRPALRHALKVHRRARGTGSPLPKTVAHMHRINRWTREPNTPQGGRGWLGEPNLGPLSVSSSTRLRSRDTCRPRSAT